MSEQKEYVVMKLVTGEEILGIDHGFADANGGGKLRRIVEHPLIIGVFQGKFGAGEYCPYRSNDTDEVEFNVDAIIYAVRPKEELCRIHDQITNPSALALPAEKKILVQS